MKHDLAILLDLVYMLNWQACGIWLDGIIVGSWVRGGRGAPILLNPWIIDIE